MNYFFINIYGRNFLYMLCALNSLKKKEKIGLKEGKENQRAIT